MNNFYFDLRPTPLLEQRVLAPQTTQERGQMTLDRLTTVQLLVLTERLSTHAHGAWRRIHADCRHRPKQQEPEGELARRYALRMRLFRRANNQLYRRYTGHDID